MQLNMGALEGGKKYAAEHLTKRDPYRVERMNKTAGQILVEGNAAAAMGCMFAGVTVVAWYPITPSSSLPETLISYMRKYRMDKETGKATFAIVQAEDEIAALGMVVGASWAGARAMTSTSGPGISLMSEFAGLSYYAEVPAVVFDIQRVGPSTGLPTRTAQGDLLFAALNSHGDTKHVLLLPGVGRRVLRDVDGGVRPRRAPADAHLRDERSRSRHEHVDGRRRSSTPTSRSIAARCWTRRRCASWPPAGAATRTSTATAFPGDRCPATGAPAFFTRGSGHNEMAQYTERPDDYVKNLDRLARKFETAKTLVPAPDRRPGGEGRRRDHRVRVEPLRRRGSRAISCARRPASRRPTSGCAPIHSVPTRTSSSAVTSAIYIVEQNRDAQMRSLLLMDGEPEFAARLRSVLHYNGLPIDARSIIGRNPEARE